MKYTFNVFIIQRGPLAMVHYAVKNSLSQLKICRTGISMRQFCILHLEEIIKQILIDPPSLFLFVPRSKSLHFALT